MFQAKYRLRKSTDIAEVFKKGKYIHGDFVLLKYKPNHQKNARIAISVSTKIFKQATKRNRIKRLLREEIAQYLNKLNGLDVLVIVKPSLSTEISSKDLKRDISTIFNKIYGIH